MKYAFLLFALLISSPSYARSITSFNDSQALLTIAQFMRDNADDLASSSRISDKKMKIKDLSNCEVVNPSVVIKEVQTAIKNVLRMFPDEELPLEEAMADLSEYIGTAPLKHCKIVQENQYKKIFVSYFFDANDKIHVKVDTVILLIL